MPTQWLASIHCQFRDIWYLRCACMYVLQCILCLSYVLQPMQLSKGLTINVTVCIVCLHFSSFCCLSSLAHFSNTEARAPASAGRAPSFTRAKSDAVYVCGLSLGHGYLSMAVFICIYRKHSYRWTAVVPRSNWRSWALGRKTQVQDQIRYWVWPWMGLFKYLHVHHAAAHVYVKKMVGA